MGEGESLRTALLAISPHLDDAVFGCGELIAAHRGATVLTLFAGVPAPAQPLTDWDAGCGFVRSTDAMLERRREDRSALQALGARPCWLDFLDAQYAAPPDAHAIADAIRRALETEPRSHAPDTVALPLGLFHSDHKLVCGAALALLDERHTWLAYEDALYRRIEGAVQARRAELAALGVRSTPIVAPGGTAEHKRRAVRCYASQLRGLATPGRPGQADLAAPERYWRLAR